MIFRISCLFGIIFYGFSAMAVTQEWYGPAKITWSEDDPALVACMTVQIKNQGHYSSEGNVFWAGFLPQETDGFQMLSTSYCLVDAQGYCKEAYDAIIEAKDSAGWKNDFSEYPKLTVTANSMGRYITFLSHETGATKFVMDLDACKTFFLVE